MVSLNHIRYNVPGILLSVNEGGNSVKHYASGFSHVEDKTPMMTGLLFQCGVITRLFTMGILLRLVDKGAFDLDDPLEWVAAQHKQDRGLLNIVVSEYPFLKPVTVRELLGNTSGLPAFDKTIAYNEIFVSRPRKIWQIENYLDVISGVDVRYQRGYEPGVRGYYSNSATNYFIAGLVIEAVSGIKTSENMRNLFQEFRMKNTYYFPYGVMETTLKSRMMHGYLPISHPFASAFERLPQVTYNDNKELRAYDVTGQYTVNGMSNSASVSTTTDLIDWLKQLLNCKVVINNYRQMVTPVAVKKYSEGENNYCFGFYKTRRKDYGEIIWTAGNALGYSVLLAHALNKAITFALVVNVSREYVSLQIDGLVADVLQQLLN